MKIRALEAFDAYLRHGGTQAAADAMGVGQPLVSKLLTGLEKEVGFKLFERRRNHLAPTPEALLFHESVTRTLDAYRELGTEVEAIATQQRGNIVIAAQPIFCDTFLLDTIARFKTTHPDVGVRLVDVGLGELLRMIAERTCDIGLGITLEADAYGAVVTPLGRCEARCALPVDHPRNKPGAIPLPRIRYDPFVELAPGSPLRTRVDYLFQTIDVRRIIAAELRTLRGVCDLVAKGTGIAVIDPIAELLIDRRRVATKPLIPTIDWEIALFSPRDRPLSRVAQTFVDTLRVDIARLKRKGLISG
ncbi:LysR family transcriptional regulator [Roseivivax halodurans JCM 10272]|uniref:LysR family transcriptional regulator n=1 Tax=Roseivivax halodurans JCM 10272 TaxID=1449350 RepID=X7ECY6_9RHOB|nr:LysR family transcriptional regulator [Roseivivax halodurans]ETX13812.1 LysR family transcriptional regulator [Roseivivax halodurans JCM 10272]